MQNGSVNINQDLFFHQLYFIFIRMSKTLIFVFALVACTLATAPFEQIKGIVERDECSINGMESITPKLKEKIAILQQVLPSFILGL